MHPKRQCFIALPIELKKCTCTLRTHHYKNCTSDIIRGAKKFLIDTTCVLSSTLFFFFFCLPPSYQVSTISNLGDNKDAA